MFRTFLSFDENVLPTFQILWWLDFYCYLFDMMYEKNTSGAYLSTLKNLFDKDGFD